MLVSSCGNLSITKKYKITSEICIAEIVTSTKVQHLQKHPIKASIPFHQRIEQLPVKYQVITKKRRWLLLHRETVIHMTQQKQNGVEGIQIPR